MDFSKFYVENGVSVKSVAWLRWTVKLKWMFGMAKRAMKSAALMAWCIHHSRKNRIRYGFSWSFCAVRSRWNSNGHENWPAYPFPNLRLISTIYRATKVCRAIVAKMANARKKERWTYFRASVLRSHCLCRIFIKRIHHCWRQSVPVSTQHRRNMKFMWTSNW